MIEYEILLFLINSSITIVLNIYEADNQENKKHLQIIDVQMDLVIRTGPENVASIVDVGPFHQLQATYHVIIGSNFQ